ncbi:hypothetical protein CJU90_3386 [Yarrowia sp. C11]|nr:hypothetical protein CKK34_4833 [Yarrowia sp. E02]KAG5369849.1 hypothetical protein CJU90_3386 [Yarrowia sp. C11]
MGGKVNLLEDLETQYEIDKLDLVAERGRLREQLVTQLTTCWKSKVCDIPTSAEKTRWTSIFGTILKEFSEQLVYELDDENYAALAFKKRLSMSIESTVARLLPFRSLTEVCEHMDDTGAELGDAIHVQKLRERVDRELLEDTAVSTSPTTTTAVLSQTGYNSSVGTGGTKNGRGRKSQQELDIDFDSGSSLSSPPPAKRRRRTKEEMERDNRRLAQGKLPEFRWTTATQLRLRPIDAKSPTLCQDTFKWYTSETISGKSIKTMYKSRVEQNWLSSDPRSQKLFPKYIQMITRMDSIHKHVLKEYATWPPREKDARLREGLRQEVLVQYYDKVLEADEGLAEQFMAPYSAGALAVIARAVLKLYSLDFQQGLFD